MTIREGILWAKEKLMGVCQRPQFEAELLMAFHLQKERTYLVTHDNEQFFEIEAFRKLIHRRAQNEPYEYIVGSASFYDIYLDVERGVLIPRPETEILVDLVAEIIEKENITHMVEIGIGSGAISIVLARKFNHLSIIATDISDTALRVAQQNIDHFKLSEHIELRKSNLIDDVSESISLVVSNPPYIKKEESLEENIIKYEPHEALFGGVVGDELLKKIILDVKHKNIKYLACEMGYDQKESMLEFIDHVGVKSATFYKDLSGLDRGFIVQFYA